jgi:hypothetical protein
MVLVSQWFDIRETPREFAFCAHANNKPEGVFAIEDGKGRRFMTILLLQEIQM